MISFLRGKVIETGKNWVILDVSGVGYRISMAGKEINSLSKNNGEIKVYTQMQFNQREGVSELYGFLRKDDLETFGLLTSVSGIGPKNAMNILASIEMRELFAAVSKEDADYLRKVSGLGPKTAKRLVVELKDKIDKLVLVGFAKLDLGQEIDAIDALVSLGYQKYQAQEALRKVSEKAKDVEGKVKEALKILNQPRNV